MAKWEKVAKVVTPTSTTIAYESPDIPDVRIESRKVQVPHANGNSGYWEQTSYFLIKDGAEKEFWRLKEAKDAAEVNNEETETN